MKPTSLSDSDVKDIVYVALMEMLNVDNNARDLDYDMGRYPDFYDTYSNEITRDEFYSDDYWLDFSGYNRPTGQIAVQYIYIFILPKNTNDTFYVATNYYSKTLESWPGGKDFEIWECMREDLVNIRYALLNETDPDLSGCRSLGGFRYIHVEDLEFILEPFEPNEFPLGESH